MGYYLDEADEIAEVQALNEDYQRDLALQRRALNEIDVGEIVRGFHVTVDLASMRDVISQKASGNGVQYWKDGPLVGDDHATKQFEQDNYGLVVRMRTRPMSMGLPREMVFSDFFVRSEEHRVCLPMILSDGAELLLQSGDRAVMGVSKEKEVVVENDALSGDTCLVSVLPESVVHAMLIAENRFFA